MGQGLKVIDINSTKEEVLEAVKKRGYALAYASDIVKLDKEVVLEAVKQNGFALQYASRAMKDDEDVVMAALSQCWEAVEYASNKIKYEIIQNWLKSIIKNKEVIK